MSMRHRIVLLPLLAAEREPFLLDLLALLRVAWCSAKPAAVAVGSTAGAAAAAAAVAPATATAAVCVSAGAPVVAAEEPAKTLDFSGCDVAPPPSAVDGSAAAAAETGALDLQG